jgi:hypothetical protein
MKEIDMSDDVAEPLAPQVAQLRNERKVAEAHGQLDRVAAVDRQLRALGVRPPKDKEKERAERERTEREHEREQREREQVEPERDKRSEPPKGRATPGPTERAAEDRP